MSCLSRYLPLPRTDTSKVLAVCPLLLSPCEGGTGTSGTALILTIGQKLVKLKTESKKNVVYNGVLVQFSKVTVKYDRTL